MELSTWWKSLNFPVLGEEENVLYMGVIGGKLVQKMKLGVPDKLSKIEIRKLVNVCVCSNKIMLLGVLIRW